MNQPTNEQIRELAEKVIANGNQKYGNPNWYGIEDIEETGMDYDDAAFICAIPPRTIIDLLDRLKAAEANRDDICKNLQRSYVREGAAEAKLAELAPYIGHTADCEIMYCANGHERLDGKPPECDCELQSILESKPIDAKE